MSANDRIQVLLNKYGQTIQDLPKPSLKGGGYSIYDRAQVWKMINDQGWILQDYILHLASVIDVMEIALTNAARHGGPDGQA